MVSHGLAILSFALYNECGSDNVLANGREVEGGVEEENEGKDSADEGDGLKLRSKHARDEE